MASRRKSKVKPVPKAVTKVTKKRNRSAILRSALASSTHFFWVQLAGIRGDCIYCHPNPTGRLSLTDYGSGARLHRLNQTHQVYHHHMEVEVTPDFPAVGEAPAETAVLNDRGEFFFLTSLSCVQFHIFGCRRCLFACGVRD